MFKNIKNDVLGGITAAVVALPLALAFGVASGAGAQAGIYGAIILGFFASLFGGTATQISGPTGPMTVIIAAAIVSFQNDLASVMTIIFLAGLIQISFGFSGIGKWIKFIPYPVISGFMSGIGVIIIILQINPFLGVDGFGSVIQTLIEIPNTLHLANDDSLVIAYITLIIMFLTPKVITKVIPSALIALIVMTIFTIYYGFDVKVIGEIPTSLPEFVLPFNFDILKLSDILMYAVTLALLGTIDTLLTSLVADSMTKTKHRPNKELIGQGIGNTLCSFVGGIPGAGATMRTVINIKSGGKTKISGMTHSIMLLITVVFFAKYAAQVPLAVLSGILIKVGVDIIDYRFFRIMNVLHKNDLLIMITVLLLTVFVDLIMAVGAGITFAAISAVYKISKQTRIQTIKSFKDSPFDIDIDNSDIRILKIDGAFFFGSAMLLERRIKKVLRAKHIIIDCKNIPFLDISAIITIEETINLLNEYGIKVSLVVKERDRRRLVKIEDSELFKNIKIYKDIDLAINEIQKEKLQINE
ncbi:MAG: SulP family inorganic anion transporter [Arcobacter sp.]|uniref:SulP family inorganic anion transporter n=1 Tax=Arcobacter sp. TaxID=1872629 RepID=UPI003B008540